MVDLVHGFAEANGNLTLTHLRYGPVDNQPATARGFGHENRPSDLMRTGADYREALRDGRKVFVMGEGALTT